MALTMAAPAKPAASSSSSSSSPAAASSSSGRRAFAGAGRASAALLAASLLRASCALSVLSGQRGLDDHEPHIVFDPEPLELNASAFPPPGLFAGGGLRRFGNPKNGTPWYRMKRVSEQGQSTHSHFDGLTADGDFASDALSAHNAVRRRVGVAPLEWSERLAALAGARVHKLANEGCYIRHSPLHERWEEAGFMYVGENLYKVINMAPTGVDVVDAWYAEIEDYNYGPVGATCTKRLCAGRASPPCTLGHFTQVMWASTTHVGCARAACPNEAQETFVAVCHYGPGGNIVGRLPFAPSASNALGLSQQACDGSEAPPYLEEPSPESRRASSGRGGGGRGDLRSSGASAKALSPFAVRALAALAAAVASCFVGA